METTDREDCTPMAWYPSLYAPRTGGAYDSHYRTAGIAGRTRRCCSRVAAGGARAAARDAGRWVSQQSSARRVGGPSRSVSPRPSRSWLCRRSKRLTRISLGEGRYERLAAYAVELVRRAVTVIVTAGGDPAAQAAKAATATIPIVFVSGSDPVKVGLVASLNRPGGNITGVHLLILGLGAKRLGLLHELMPTVNLVGLLVNPNF